MIISNKIRVILFDLGGVLVELDGPPLKKAWLKDEISEAENWRRWGQSSLVEVFETGHIGAQEFVRGIIAELHLQVSEEAFMREFTAWPKGLFKGVDELLRGLRKDYLLACYSNTSELHWPRLMQEMGLQSMLDRCFASFEIGCFKPALKGFYLILEELGVAASEVLFLDDNWANVEAAKKAGLSARQVRGHTELKTVLRELGLTPV